MQRKIFWGLNLLKYIAILVVDYIYLSPNKDFLGKLIHMLVSLTVYPLLLAAVLNSLVALIPFKAKSYTTRWKEYFVYSVSAILFFLLTGSLAYLVTH